MRKADLKAGEEYAAGSNTRGYQWRMSRVRVVEVDGERPRANGTVERGVVVVLVGNSNPHAWPLALRGLDGKEAVLPSGRDIQMPWATYEQARAEFDVRQDASRAESARAAGVADDAEARLDEIGAAFTRSGSGFRFTADEMAALLAMLPAGRSTA